MSGPPPSVKLKALYGRLLRVPAKMSAPVALRITKAWKRCYAAGQDPYGRPWAKLAPSTLKRKKGPSIMRESEETFDATRAVAAAGAGVRLTTGGTAEYHQEAHGSRPARPVIPDHGVPPEWIQSAREVGVDLARKAVGG